MKLAVNLRASFYMIAMLTLWVGIAFLIPLIVAVTEQEPLWPWLASIAIVAISGLLLRRLTRNSGEIGLREAFFVTGLSWFFMALAGALPYLLMNSLGFVDAFFESMSGFTTTGATVILDIPGQAKSLLVWRSFSQWLGGMGIIVLAVAILPQLAVAGRQLLETERAATERLTPRLRETAQTLWVLYLGLTVAEIVALLATGVSFYDASLHAMATMPSGGFSPRALGTAELFPSAQWIITLFMFFSGVNFTVMYLSLSQGPKQFLRDSEFKLYSLIILIAATLLVINIWDLYPTLEESIRHGLFQAVSILTTTGFASVDFNNWNPFCQVLLLVLMLTGASAGSTAGGIKVIRLLLWGKLLVREIRQTLHPRAVIPVRLGARVVSEQALRGIAVFTLLFFGLFILGALFLLLDAQLNGGVGGQPLSAIEALTAAATSLGNTGPGVGVFGPMNSFAPLTDQSKLVLALLMWIGRLEIMPVLVLLTVDFWKS